MDCWLRCRIFQLLGGERHPGYFRQIFGHVIKPFVAFVPCLQLNSKRAVNHDIAFSQRPKFPSQIWPHKVLSRNILKGALSAGHLNSKKSAAPLAPQPTVSFLARGHFNSNLKMSTVIFTYPTICTVVPQKFKFLCIGFASPCQVSAHL